MNRLEWANFKAFIDARNLPIHEVEQTDTKLTLEAYDGPVARFCKIIIGSADHTDYTTNYQAAANPSLTDSNGVTLQRTKITSTGWHYQCHAIEFETSKLSSLYNSDVAQTDQGFTSIKFYDNTATELVAGTQVELDNNCVKTVIDFEPTYDIEVLGGSIYQCDKPTVDVRLWVTAAPDIPANLGGTVSFCEGGANMKHMGEGLVYDIDGKTPKLMPYSAVYHSNKFRLTLTHPTGHHHNMMLIMKLFRENA